METTQLNWAVIGCGVIANEMAQGLAKMSRTLYSVANRTHEKAVQFAQVYNVRRVYDAIDEVFTDLDVDIIYITTPHNTHYKYMKKALENGKHIFVEKSITLNSRELAEMISLAKERGLLIGEATSLLFRGVVFSFVSVFTAPCCVCQEKSEPFAKKKN